MVKVLAALPEDLGFVPTAVSRGSQLCSTGYSLSDLCEQWQVCGGQLSFHHADPRDWTQVLRLGGKDLYLMTHIFNTCDSAGPGDMNL